MEIGGKLVQPRQLVLGERLGRKKVQGTGLRIFHQRRQDRQVEAQRLAAGRAGGQDDIFAAAGMGPGLDLMAVQRGDAPVHESLSQGWRQVGRERSQIRGARRRRPPGRNVQGGLGVIAPVREQGQQGHTRGLYPHQVKNQGEGRLRHRKTADRAFIQSWQMRSRFGSSHQTRGKKRQRTRRV